MKAGLRFGIAAAAAALAIGQPPALAQETPPPAGNATETIGPRELEGFSLNGAVTRPAPEREEPRPAPPRTPPATTAPAQTRPAPAAAAPERPAAPTPRAPSAAEPERPSAQVPAAPSAEAAPAPSSSVTVSLPPAGSPAPAFTPEPLPQSNALAGNQGLSPLPWILALLLLAGAAGFYFHRQRSRGEELAFAGGAAEAFAPPRPAPAPPVRAPAPAPAPAPPATPAPPASTGIVSTRLRPWVEIEFEPLRCIVEEKRASIEFTVSLFNSGSAPARDVLIEAAMINAGVDQDQEIGAFFNNPAAQGERIPAIPPLQRIALKTAVGLPIEQLRHFEGKGRRFFVPLVAFNALYRWGSNEGQTSLSYLVGRDGQGEKMAPFRLDLGPRMFRGLGAREHQLKIRR